MGISIRDPVASKHLKVKLFSLNTDLLLEQELNSWLKSNDFDIHDVIYQHTKYPPYETYSCMVIYTTGRA